MKILIIRFSSIGDIVLTSPVIRCVAKQLDAEIHYLTKQAYTSLLTANPYVSQVHGWSSESHAEVMDSLAQENFDHVIDLHKNLRSKRIKLALGVPSSTFPKLNMQKWLRVNLKYDVLPDRHIVDRYLEAATPLGVKNDYQGLDFHLSDDSSDATTKPYIAFAIGAAHATKRMTNLQIEDLCRALDHATILLGGAEEKTLGSELDDKLPHVTSFCGSSSLIESAHLIQKSSLLVTHDTGMMHIGAALKKPIISIWGNTIPEFGMYPYYPRDLSIFSKMFQVADLPCRPCSKIGYGSCPKGHFRCMKNHDITAISDSCNEFLSNRSSDSSSPEVFLS